MFKLPQSSVAVHKKGCLTPVARKMNVVEVPKPPEGATAQELAKWHCDRIDARVKAAEAHGSGISEKELTGLYGMYTRACQHRDKLSGAMSITESQIVRSAPWARLMSIAVDSLEKDHPRALKALSDAVSAFAEGKA